MFLSSDLAGLILLLLYFLAYLLAFFGPLLPFIVFAHVLLQDFSKKTPRPVLPPTATVLTTNQCLLGIAAALLAFLYYAAADTSRWLARQWRQQQQRRATNS